MEVDRKRGKLSVKAEDGTYTPGSHFANWNWKLKAPRWGKYYVQLRYTSVMPKRRQVWASWIRFRDSRIPR